MLIYYKHSYKIVIDGETSCQHLGVLTLESSLLSILVILQSSFSTSGLVIIQTFH